MPAGILRVRQRRACTRGNCPHDRGKKHTGRFRWGMHNSRLPTQLLLSMDSYGPAYVCMHVYMRLEMCVRMRAYCVCVCVRIVCVCYVLRARSFVRGWVAGPKAGQADVANRLNGAIVANQRADLREPRHEIGEPLVRER
jgi:hypothetical protein